MERLIGKKCDICHKRKPMNKFIYDMCQDCSSEARLCEKCNKSVHRTKLQFNSVTGQEWCTNCRNKKCTGCNNLFDIKKLENIYGNGKLWCKECISSKLFCYKCNDLVPWNNIYTNIYLLPTICNKCKEQQELQEQQKRQNRLSRNRYNNYGQAPAALKKDISCYY